MILTLEDFLGIALGVAAGSVPVLLTYYLSERGSRRQLEREQEYGRRREKYEQVLTALLRQRDLTQSFQAFLRLQAEISTSHPSQPLTPTGDAEKDRLNELWMIISKLLAIGTEILAEIDVNASQGRNLLESQPEDRARLFGSMVHAFTRCVIRSDLDFRLGIQSLILVEASEEFVGRATNLSNLLSEPLSAPMTQGVPPTHFMSYQFDWEKIEQEMNDLNLLALQDLKSVLGVDVDVYLVRKRPPSTVETKTGAQVRKMLVEARAGRSTPRELTPPRVP